MTAAAYLDMGKGEAPGIPPTGYLRLYIGDDGILYGVDDADNTAALSGNLSKVGQNGEPDHLSLAFFQRTELGNIEIKPEAIGSNQLALNINAADKGFNAALLGGVSVDDLSLVSHGHVVSDIADLFLPTHAEIVLWRGAEWTNGAASVATAFSDKRTAIRVDKTRFPESATIKLQLMAKSAGASDTMTINLLNVSDDSVVATDAIAITSAYQLVESVDLAASLPASSVDIYLQAGGAALGLSLWGAVLTIEW